MNLSFAPVLRPMALRGHSCVCQAQRWNARLGTVITIKPSCVAVPPSKPGAVPETRDHSRFLKRKEFQETGSNS